MLLFAAVSAQTVTLTFTGRDASNQYVPLNRVVVSNLTRGWQETLFWPDTVLVMTDQTGIEDVETFPETSLRLSQNNPNPFDGTTYVNLNVTEPGEVSLVMTDISGRIVGANHYSPLQPGIHEIRITLSSAGIYFLTARQNGQTASVKMVNSGNGNDNAITFTDNVGANNYSPLPQSKTEPKANTDNLFVAGDQMQYVGFTNINGAEEEGGHVIQTQDSTQTIVLSFPQPCLNTPIVMDYDSNVYNTVQIGNQCWMKENLRTTHYADGTAISAGFSISPYSGNVYFQSSYTEPYYYDYSNEILPLESRGYLYNWSAVMNGEPSSASNPSGVQGICPTGWHVPSNAEWTQLIDFVGSIPAYLCTGSNGDSYVAKALASTEGWSNPDYEHDCAVGSNPSTNNASGFGVVPVGIFWNSSLNFAGYEPHFWSSTRNNNTQSAFQINFHSDYGNTGGGVFPFFAGFSVRCLRD